MKSFSRQMIHAAALSAAACAALAVQSPQPSSRPDAGRDLASRALLRTRPQDANVPQVLSELKTRAAAAANPALAKMVNAWADAPAALGQRTIVYLDLRTGGPVAVQPDGLPWIPGTGVNNRLTGADLAPYLTDPAPPSDPADPPDANGVTQAVLERIARQFMADHPAWFPVAGDQLVSLPPIPDPGYPVRHVLFSQVVNGVPVEGARLVFNIGHGNLVSFGGQYLGPVTQSATPIVSPGDARRAALRYAGLDDAAVAWTDKQPALRFVIADDGAAVPLGGYRHRLVYQAAFRADGRPGTWRAEVDALSGEIVSFQDINDYGTIVGGVQPLSNDGICPTGCEQPGYPMPFADYTNAACTTAPAGPFTDTGGNFPASYAGTVNSKLCGRYVRTLNDATGCPGAAISEGNAAGISLDLGTSGGTDCVIPTNGNPTPHSAGDTHSVRDAFYNVNKLKEEVRGWLPAWTFNNNQVTVNVNLNQACNAYWDGLAGTLNMFKSGAVGTTQCRNTGEIAMIFDHELGHGYDSNDGGGSTRPGEAYADNAASIHHHDSCIGRGFFVTRQCAGYGDACTACSGVRGSDWTKHVSGRPHTIFDLQTGNNTAPNTPMQCPTGGDICSFETHCAAYPITEAVWDAATIDLPHNPIPANGGAACAGTSPGNPTTPSQAWTLLSRIWWKSVGAMGDQYACATTGTAGCGATAHFHLIKVQDDDDGNLANGTPHAAELQCAYNRHQVGCTTDNNVDFTICPALPAPTVTATAGNGQAALSWTAVASATKYRIYRNEEGCGAGYSLITTIIAPTTSYTDSGLLNGRTYYYQVQPIAGASDQCDGQPSACATVTPQPCVAPGTPTFGTATNSAGTNSNTVTWTNGAPASAKFNVYRSTGTCAAGTFTAIATGVAASPYVDSTGSGGITYAYKVSGTESTGLCESPLSAGCATATATGPCTLPPTFAGATSATNNAQATCTATVAWSAGTKQCAAASPTVTYNVYRSTTAGFTPAPANRIAAGLTGTGYTDNVGISSGTTYYYVVRAVDSLGNEDANTVQVSTAPTGPVTSSFSDNAGDTGTATLTLGAPWSVATTGGAAGPKVYQTGAYANNTCASITTPSFNLAANSTLTFASKYDTELGWDKGIVEISTNGGTTWAKLTTVNYPGNSTRTGDACALGATGASFTGSNLTYATYTASLAGFSGATTRLRWRFSSDTSITGTGWWVDDIVVQAAAACATGTRPPEVTPTGATTALLASKASNPALVVLTFADMAGASGYNVYEGALPMAAGSPYTHEAPASAGNVCAVVTTPAAGRLSTPASGIGTAGSHYYLVTQFTAAEGPSGFDSSAVEIPPAKSTCPP